MVSNIGGAGAAQAAYAATPKASIEQAPAASVPAPAPVVEETPSAPAQGAESAAAARLGEQLNADVDAARVQRAVDEMPAETGEASSGTTTAGAAPSQAPAKGAGGGGAAGAASSATTDTDYIAEADTNSDKTVSDEERAAYEAKLREQNDKGDEVRAAYGQDETAAPALDVSA